MRGAQPHKNSNLSQVTWKSTTAVRCALGLQDIGCTTPNKCQAKSETASWRHPELTSQFTRVVFLMSAVATALISPDRRFKNRKSNRLCENIPLIWSAVKTRFKPFWPPKSDDGEEIGRWQPHLPKGRSQALIAPATLLSLRVLSDIGARLDLFYA